MSTEEIVEEFTFKNYDNDDNYKLFYTCDFPVEKDEEIAESIRQSLLNIDGQNELGIEPFICMKKNSKGYVFPSLKLYVPTCGSTRSDFSQLTPERILDELWRVRLEWKYNNIPDSKENSKWLFGLPTVPEIYPRSPVPIELPAGDVCSECAVVTPEIISCPNQNRFIINAREQKTILKKGKTPKNTKNVVFKGKRAKTAESATEVFPVKYETAGQSKMEIINKQLPTRWR